MPGQQGGWDALTWRALAGDGAHGLLRAHHLLAPHGRHACTHAPHIREALASEYLIEAPTVQNYRATGAQECA